MGNKPTPEELSNRFSYHPPKANQPEKYEHIRKKCNDLARDLVMNVPTSPELDRALDHLDLVMMLANAGIARHS